MADIGYVTLPVIPSFEGIDAKVNKAFLPLGKKAGKDFSKGMGDGLKSLEVEVKKAGDAYSKMRDKAEDSLGKVRVAEAALTKARSSNDTARIVAAEERLATARRNSSRSTKDAGDAYRLLTNAQKDLGDGTDNLGGKFGKLDSLAGGASKALTTGVVVAAGATVLAVAALAAGVLAAGNALYDLGKSFDDTFDNIRIKTGATGPALQQLEKATERLATKVPLSIGEIGNVVAETSRALHLTGPELDNVARSIADLGRLTGENVDIRTLGKAFRGFGVDAKDQVPALNSLLRASQKTGVGVNELLATVVKGGAGLRQFGFDFGESAALATQFEEAGLDSNKAMMGLTKGLATLAKDGQTGQQALKDTVSHIKDLMKIGTSAGDAQALDLTNKLFGARGGAQFFEAIKNGVLDLDTLADSLGDTGDTIAQAAADTDDWSERWQVFKNQLAVGLEPIATGVFDTINGKLTELADWVSNNQDKVIQFFGRIGDFAIRGAQNILKFAADSLRALGEFIKGFEEFKPTFDTLANTGSVLRYVPGFQDLGLAMKQAGEGGQALVEGLDGAPDRLNEGADALERLSQNVGDAVGPWDALIDRTAQASKFTQALGDATASLPDGKTIKLSSNAPEVSEGLDKLGIKIVEMPDGSFEVKAETAEAERILQSFREQQTDAPVVVKAGVDLSKAKMDLQQWIASLSAAPAVNVPIAAAPPGYNPLLPAGRAGGGSIFGPGGPTADQVPIMASAGEHMWTAAEVNAVGGQANMYRLRALARKGALQGFATGGGLSPLAVPWGVDPHGSRDREDSAGPFGPWWDTDWMPVENPEEVGPGQGRWWYRGPTKAGRSKFSFPPLGRYRKRLPSDLPNLPPDPRTKTWGMGFSEGGAVQRLATGGAVAGPYDALGFAQSISGSGYGAAAGPTVWDCSGFMSDIYAILTGKPYTGGERYFTTEADFEALGFVKGYDPNSAFNIGVSPAAVAGSNAHMAGTLMGYNVESGGGTGGGPHVGSGAAGAMDAQFAQQYHLPIPMDAAYGPGSGSDGYGAPDPQKIADAERNLRDANAKLAIEEQQLRELKSDASQSERMRAEDDARKAREDRAEAIRELEESKKGKGGKTTGGSSSKSGSLSGTLADMAGQATTMGINGLFETIGADGSWLPDIQNMGIMKTLSAALGIKVHTGDGTYSVMGFEPNQGQGGASGTSSAPFGMPSPATQMPQLPGAAASVVNGPSGAVDQSTNIHINNPQGTAEDAANRVRTVIKNTPRVDTHVPPGF